MISKNEIPTREVFVQIKKGTEKENIYIKMKRKTD